VSSGRCNGFPSSPCFSWRHTDCAASAFNYRFVWLN
jgi:hypothetical protein